MTLFDWVHLVGLVEVIIETISPRQLDLDLLGKSHLRLMDPRSLLALEGGEQVSTGYTKDELTFSSDKYRLVGFLEGLDTLGVLNRPGRSTKVIYPGLTSHTAVIRNFYGARPGKPTILLGLNRIATKEDCRSFLDDSKILSWRQAMEDRYRASPLFESDEVWRVLCHELATNVWEHSGSTGFAAARVVDSATDERGRLRTWCRWTYDPVLHPLLKNIKGGFLELCVADAGEGFVETLREFMLTKVTDPARALPAADVLAFAFDELSTCKNERDSWATARHGLCRVLSLVAKYGGALSLRSAGAELIYVAETDRFQRRQGNLGYEPQSQKEYSTYCRGSEIQIILPLIPLFQRPRADPAKSRLDLSLPKSFRTQPDQFRGHLVPLLEVLETPDTCIGPEELRAFRARCEILSRDIMEHRPRTEPLVLDFSELNWTAAQFETLLYLLQNVLQHRPVLLVELADQLADQVVESERDGRPTTIDPSLAPESRGAAQQVYDEVAEGRFLETYRGIHATVLGATRTRRRKIFGLPADVYEAALLSLLVAPLTIEEICTQYPDVQENVIRSILTSQNPLFECHNGLWSLTWTENTVQVEMTRAVQKHFDSVAVRSLAWRGRKNCGDTGNERFYIPWSNVWRKEFLQASRILSRGRQVDEIAQRLIFRLKMNLGSLVDVKTLICTSAPAMLLATAIHRWWPDPTRPAVADLGHYLFLGDHEQLPLVASEGGIVLVQDVLDDGKVTQWVVERLRGQGKEVLFVLSFVSFVGNDKREIGVRSEALIPVPSPPTCPAPLRGESDESDYWVEPWALRPVPLTTLRREWGDPDLERRNDYLSKFDDSARGCLLMSGHFVYGVRHFAVTVDIRRTLDSEIGEEIARWVADVCEGGERERAPWERDEAYQLKGDVTAVLMPLHSQIHYLWPRVETLLAQRGRRQPMWLLEPLLFTGSGPSYRLPVQFRHQIEEVFRDRFGGDSSEESLRPLRILVLDDAVASGRTATTVFSTIIAEAEKAVRELAPLGVASPVEWIRYFSVLNQADFSSYTLWRGISALGHPPIKIAMEEYAPFMGVTVHGESDCPVCKDLARLRLLMKTAEDFGGQGAGSWIAERIEELAPKAVDGSGFRGPLPKRLSRRLDVLAPREGAPITGRYRALHVATAIWRLHELMYLSYPPSEVLVALDDAWPQGAQEQGLQADYERYRWAVYEWCVRNWRRVTFDSASELFCRLALKEVERATGLVEPLLEAVSTRFDDEDIAKFIDAVVALLLKLEAGRTEEGRATDPERIRRTIQLDTGLQLLFFNVERFVRVGHDERAAREGNGAYRRLLEYLDSAASALDGKGHSLLRNLHRRLTKPRRLEAPSWGLETIAESLFRGRSERDDIGSHKLLPRLLWNVLQRRDDEDIRLLHGSLVLFLAALGEIRPYAVDFSIEAASIISLAEKVLDWLRSTARSPRDLSPARQLFRALRLNDPFCREFEQVFHGSIEDILAGLNNEAEKWKGRLILETQLEADLAGGRVLTHVQRLVFTLLNRTIDPIERSPGTNHHSRICVYSGERDGSPGEICFKIMTNFADPHETAVRLGSSRHSRPEENILEVFGARFTSWIAPEREDGSSFLAESKIFVPEGFKRKGGLQ